MAVGLRAPSVSGSGWPLWGGLLWARPVLGHGSPMPGQFFLDRLRTGQVGVAHVPMECLPVVGQQALIQLHFHVTTGPVSGRDPQRGLARRLAIGVDARWAKPAKQITRPSSLRSIVSY